MKYNLSFKDGNGKGYAIESYLLIAADDNKPRRVCRIFEMKDHSLQPESILILEGFLSPLIKSLISIDRMVKQEQIKDWDTSGKVYDEGIRDRADWQIKPQEVH